MILQQIHGTTLLLHFAGKKILIDPALSFMENASQDSRALVHPCAIQEFLRTDAIIFTSLYEEHYDDTAGKLLPKVLPVFVLDQMDQANLKSSGFTNVTIVKTGTLFGNISLSKLPLNGSPNGILLEHPAEKSLFITGDSVWNDAFLNAVHHANPRAIAVNCGTEELLKATPCTLDTENITKLSQAAPNASLITCHIEAFSQWGLNRDTLQKFILENNLSRKFILPEDGKNYYL